MNKTKVKEDENTYNLDEKGKQEFKDRLITLRKQKGWVQEDIAEKLDVSRQTVSKWESTQTMPEVDKVIKLSKLYNITMDELVYGENKSLRDNTINGMPSLEDNIEFVNAYKESKLKRKVIKKYMPRILAAVVLIGLIAYLISVIHNFVILKELNNKFNEYKNVNNCYYERKELVTNDAGTVYILNTRYWYKDGILKREEKKTENGTTKTNYVYIDTNNNIIYNLFEQTKKGTKKYNNNDYKKIENGILKYLIGLYYNESNFEIMKDACLSKVSNDENNYVVESGIKEYKKNIYNKETGLIEQTITKDKEEIKVIYNIKINVVTDDDIKLNLEGYNIVEK